MKEGVPVTVNVVNDTDFRSLCTCHGLLIPSDWTDPRKNALLRCLRTGSRSYRFYSHAGRTRWYHTHTMSMDDLHRGSYYRNVRLPDH